MRIRHVLSVAILSVLFMAGCKEFIEPSLKDKKIVLLAPAESHQSNKYNITFWWETTEDALGYRLQIVSPRFDSIGYLVTDTVVKTDKFSFVLEPGRYEWRIRAENGSSESLYTSRSLIILASDIKDQQVQLKSPGNNAVTNQKKTTYRWEPLFGAVNYRLQVDTSNFSNEDILVFNDITPNTEFALDFKKESIYQWRVRAETDSSQSGWSAINQIGYDITPPAKAILNSPATDQVLVKPVSLKWDAVQTASKYELAVLKADSTSAYNPTFPVTLTGTSYNFTLGASNEKLFWKVRAIDAAGNAGVYSDLRNFTIQ